MTANLLRKVIPERFRPIGYLNHLVRSRTNGCVRAGPFQGMRYISRSVGSAYIPKLLGIYERELTSVVEAACAASPGLVIDIGAAEGYYAVGLARRNPKCRVIAFEMEANGRAALAEMAALNGVDPRVSIKGKCEPTDLRAVLAGGDRSPLIVCDVEGYEEQLLNPREVPELSRASILVELHDFIVPSITQTLLARFERTHSIAHIWQEPRARTDFPWNTFVTRVLPKSYLDWAVSEWRPVRMAWLWMAPK